MTEVRARHAPQRAPRRAHAGGLAALALAVLTVGCGRGEAPTWTRLATLFRPADVRRAADAKLATPAGRPLRLEHGADHAWLVADVARDDWFLQLPPSLWRAHVGLLPPAGRPPEGEPLQLADGARAFAYQARSVVQPTKRLESGAFQLDGGDVQLRLESGEEPPALLSLRVFAGRGGASDAQGAPWRVRGKRFSGDALPLWPGESWEARVDLPAGAALRLATAVEALVAPADGERAEVRFRVALDGAPLLDHALAVGSTPAAERHVLALGESARRGARLTFEVLGPPACTAFLAPVIGPADPGEYGARPWEGARPDLVLFLADTFRADNLAVYGGREGVTPHLDQLAAEALVLRRAWSVGTYTLPAHASLFSGVFPRQAGILGTARALPEELETLAEVLAARGYRTGAVTDSVIVSSRYALDQGFEWFEELVDNSPESLERTRERVDAFLDADDGRPVFLFVQSYRAHLPYRVSAEALAAHGARLGIQGDFEAWRAELEELDRVPEPGPRERERRALVSRALRAHYLGGVADVDLGFERLRRGLEARGLLDHGVLVFTSDHGEAFGEHGRVYHTGPVWEEESRIPLLFWGRGIRAETRDEAVSLIDLPPTLVALAAVPVPSAWRGRSLLEEGPERTVFVFECKKSERSTLALVEGARKVIGFEDAARLERGELFGAFDLGADPGERHDLSRSGAEWPQEVLARHGRAAALLLEPVVGPEAAALSAEQLEELRAVGYAGDE